MHESFIDSHASCTGWIESLRPGWSDEMVPAEAPGSTRRRCARRTIRLAAARLTALFTYPLPLLHDAQATPRPPRTRPHDGSPDQTPYLVYQNTSHGPAASYGARRQLHPLVKGSAQLKLRGCAPRPPPDHAQGRKGRQGVQEAPRSAVDRLARRTFLQQLPRVRAQPGLVERGDLKVQMRPARRRRPGKQRRL